MGFLMKTLGMTLITLPFIFYIRYLMIHIKTKTKFDYHLKKVEDKKGKIGIITCYINRLFFGITYVFIGLNLLSEFEYELYSSIMIISLLIFVITKYIDNNNEN